MLGNYLFVMTTNDLENDGVINGELSNNTDDLTTHPGDSDDSFHSALSAPSFTSESITDDPFSTPGARICNIEQTSTPTARGQFHPLSKVGNITDNDFDRSFVSTTGNTFSHRPGGRRRITSFSTSDSESSWDSDMDYVTDNNDLQVWKFIDDFLSGEKLLAENSWKLLSK